MKKLSILLLLILCRESGFGQVLHPVSWSYAYKKTSELSGAIFVKATIAPGWHIYSLHQKSGGPVKTTIRLAGSGKRILLGDIMEPKPLVKYEKTFGIKVYYFENSVIFHQKVKPPPAPAPVLVKGQVSFMVCNDEKCLPPEDIAFEIPVK